MLRVEIPQRLKAEVPVCGMETIGTISVNINDKGLKAEVPVCGMETIKRRHQGTMSRWLKAEVPVCGMETNCQPAR